jgi:hypothetical protein
VQVGLIAVGEVHLLAFPQDILLQIFSLLPARNLCTVACVCKGWRTLSERDELLVAIFISSHTIQLEANDAQVFSKDYNPTRLQKDFPDSIWCKME